MGYKTRRENPNLAKYREPFVCAGCGLETPQTPGPTKEGRVGGIWGRIRKPGTLDGPSLCADCADAQNRGTLRPKENPDR